MTPNRAMEGTEEAEYYESPASNGDGKGDSPNRMMSPPESEAECDQRIKDWEINHGIRGNVGANESYAMIPLGMDANRFGGDFDSRFIYNIEEKLINMQRGDQEGDYRQVIWEAEDGDDDCMDTSEEESEAEESAEFEFNQYGTNIGGIKTVNPYAVPFESSYEKQSKKARKEIQDNSSREKALECHESRKEASSRRKQESRARDRRRRGGRKVQVRYSRGQAGGMDSQGKQVQEDLPACGSPEGRKAKL